jgi:hypothetical protein
LENEEVQQHTMSRLVNWDLPSTSTLIEPQQTKWRDFYQSQKVPPKHSPLYERIPLFLYCREYLEVFAEVMLEQVGNILQFEHQLTAQSWKLGE